MDVNHKGGQEMMNLNNLNDGEIKKMVGEPAQAGGRFDLKSKESASVRNR